MRRPRATWTSNAAARSHAATNGSATGAARQQPQPVFPARRQELGQQRGGRGQGWRGAPPAGLGLDRTSPPRCYTGIPPGRAGVLAAWAPLGADGSAGALRAPRRMRSSRSRPTATARGGRGPDSPAGRPPQRAEAAPAGARGGCPTTRAALPSGGCWGASPNSPEQWPGSPAEAERQPGAEGTRRSLRALLRRADTQPTAAQTGVPIV